MYLQDLPVQLGALILSYLDKFSQINAYKVFELRPFYTPSLMRKFDLSRCSAATVKTLYQDVFRDCAVHIHELNLSGIADLTAWQLSPHIKRCANLKTLDITFTSIYLPDLDIFPDNLKNISVNFFKWPYDKSSDMWKKSVDLFQRQRFENVHFIVFEAFCTESPLVFMNGVPKTKSLKVTVTGYYKLGPFHSMDIELPDLDENVDCNFEKLNYVYRNCAIDDELVAVSDLDYNQIEYIFIMYSQNCSKKIIIYVSPFFNSLFARNYSESKLNIQVNSHLPEDPIRLEGNASIWFTALNKSFTTFNDAFCKTILTELTDFFPTYLCMHNKTEMQITQAPSNWGCIDACQGFDTILDNLPEKLTLTDFCRKEGRWREGTNCPVYLTPESNTLKNITYLSVNICIRGDFFTTLFNQCKNLSTLDTEISVELCDSMHLTKSLRNIRLSSETIEYELLFASLCQCPTLENIHLVECWHPSRDPTPVTNMVSLIEKCVGLYSLFIETDMFRENMESLESSLKAAAQQLGRDYLCIKVGVFCDLWNHFADVFNPSPLQISG